MASNDIPFLQLGGDSQANWRTINAALLAIRDLRAQVNDLNQQISRLSKNRIGADLFPFAIYQLPARLRDTDDPDTDWRKVRVRNGLVFTDNAVGNAVDGTDETDAPYVADFESTVMDITVPENDPQYWIWIQVNEDNTFEIQHGSDGWVGFPDLDGSAIPIGWVDSQTSMADELIVVRQLITTDLFLGNIPVTLCDETGTPGTYYISALKRTP